MVFTKNFNKDSILDLQKEHAADRPMTLSLKEFIIKCFKAPRQTERIACRYGITDEESDKAKKIISKFTLFLSVIMTSLFVLLFILFYSSFSKTGLVAIVLYITAFVFTTISILYLIRVKKINSGLLFHWMNYNYIEGAAD